MAKHKNERRRHERRSLSCAVYVSASEGDGETPCHAINLSEGGALLSVPISSLPDLTGEVRVRLPASDGESGAWGVAWQNVSCNVVRHQPLVDDRRVAMAVRFASLGAPRGSA
jgi:PilZ domain-containing protein